MKVITIKQARKDKERRDYAALVLGCWDNQEHEAKREQMQRAAEVNAKAKEQI